MESSVPYPYGATKRPRLVWLLAGRPLMARVASPTRRRCQAAGVPTRSRIGRWGSCRLASSAGPAQTCGRLRSEVPKPRLNSGTVGGERRSGRHRPPSQASATGSGHWRPPWRCGRLCAAVWRVCGRGGGIARRGPAVGVAVSGSRPPGVVPPVQTSRPTAPPARPYYAVVRRTRRRGGAGRGRAGCARPRGVACACCAR